VTNQGDQPVTVVVHMIGERANGATSNPRTTTVTIEPGQTHVFETADLLDNQGNPHLVAWFEVTVKTADGKTVLGQLNPIPAPKP
jgi:signal recognition particle receptor subunit beta